MTARIIPFPRRVAFEILITREGAAWLVTARDHGWLYGDRSSADSEARGLAQHFGVGIREAHRG
jgi:hypothetical protein